MNERKRLREFPKWPVEQVMEVMRMLYSLAPIKRELWKDKSRWTSLARQAYDLLDHSHSAAEEIARQRNATHDAYRQSEARSANAETLPHEAPVDQLVNLAARQSEVIACIRNPAPLQLAVFGLTVAVFHRESTMPAASDRVRRWLRYPNDTSQRANDRLPAP